MSAFICSDNHFNSIRKTLKSYALGNLTSEYVYPIIRACREYGADPEAMIDTLIETMYSLNCETYGAKYSEDVSEMVAVGLSKYGGQLLETPWQLLKALKCLDYQIEIDGLEQYRKLIEPETNSLKLVTQLIGSIQDSIIRQLPEYKAAKWEIE